MAKITHTAGDVTRVIEGTIEELREMGFDFKSGDNVETTVTETYRKVTDREPRVGDFIKYDNAPYEFLTAGKYYEIVRIDDFDDPQIIDDENDEYDTSDDDFEVYEKIVRETSLEEGEVEVEPLKVGDYIVPLPSADEVYPITDTDLKLGRVVEIISDDDIKIKVIEHECEAFIGTKYLVDKKYFKATDEPLKVGDYVKIIQNPGNLREGDIAEIIERKPYEYDFYVSRLTDGEEEAFDKWEVVRATDEEVTNAKSELERGEYKVGDKVRLVSGGGNWPLYGFEDGEIYEVNNTTNESHSTGDITIEKGRGKLGFAKFEQIERVSEEELEKAKWNAIGREVGEYKVGDIVRVTGSVSSVPVGTIGVVETVDDDETFRVETEVITRGNWHSESTVELITPVERRFDKITESEAV